MTISNKSWRSYFPHLRKLPEDDQYLYSDDTNSSIIAEEELHHSVDKSSKTDVSGRNYSCRTSSSQFKA
ncbi:ADM_collapsed_G0021040.mRNA.1.CDS.1 [Saccharomyces cerevisiae]|nr:ADM_collapsed_G0021040.mRNA.1.CDS.1 [Saccharomyces cerevisiae]